jgi:fructose-bisphosphate aldolase, class II
LKGLAESKSDGIIQVSTGGAAFASGKAVKDMALGAISIAEHVHRAAERLSSLCRPAHRSLPGQQAGHFRAPTRRGDGAEASGWQTQPVQQPHVRWQRAAAQENLDIAVKLLERFKKNELILEIEVGVIRGEEDGIKASAAAKLYTTPEDTLEVARAAQ